MRLQTPPERTPEPVEKIDHSPVFVQHIGTAVPRSTLTQEEAVERMRVALKNPRTHRLIRRIARQSMIAKRHLAAEEWQNGQEGAAFYPPASAQPYGPGMGTRNARFDIAADDLVRRAAESLPPTGMEHAQSLVTVSCTHASSPGLERPIFEHTGISPRVQRWNLGFMGCSAGLAALRLVYGLGAWRQNALICTCEVSSLHFQYSDAIDQITANMLFADGAAMVTVGPQPSIVRVLDCRCMHLPSAADQMIWFAGDHGLRLELSRELPETLASHLGAAVDQMLTANGLTREAVDNWLVHPGGPRILDSVEAALGLDPNRLEDSRLVLKEFGNMSSSTIFFILQRSIERGREGLCVATAFGPGLTIELALLDVNHRRAQGD